LALFLSVSSSFVSYSFRDQASRHTGTQGDQEMAKFIRSKAIDFGIEERYVKIEEFEILMNEPEVLKINSHSDLYELKYDFMASFKAKKNGRLAVSMLLSQLFL
jgi:uncharacterized FAD-dependent dehydrogenase